jgi:hypothetical protein
MLGTTASGAAGDPVTAAIQQAKQKIGLATM